jgi:broad specificity phosphatase PhoE
LIGRLLRKQLFDLKYSSDLGRAVTTASLLLSEVDSLDKDIMTSKLIREKYFGVRENQPKDLSVLDARKRIATSRGVDVSQVIDDAETLEQLFDRQKQFIKCLKRDICSLISKSQLSAKETAGEMTSLESLKFDVLCVSHGGFIFSFLQNFTNLKLTEKIINCSLSLVTLEWANMEEFTSDINETVVVSGIGDFAKDSELLSNFAFPEISFSDRNINFVGHLIVENSPIVGTDSFTWPL